ncbi:MAG: hypothetical protein K8H90_08715, partial [Thermoanaerobaculia bacterium]|nr:hypothetical protein [Thermoanaerobaculia bacterium]
MPRVPFLVPVLALVLTTFGAASATAATLEVTADVVVVASDGQCSLREAIHNANADSQVDNADCPAGSGADTIVLASGGQYVISDADVDNDHNGLPVVTTEIVVEGNGATIERNSNFSCILDDNRTAAEFRLLEVGELGDLTLGDLTLRGGCADGSGPSNDGGAIRVHSGNLTLTRVLVEQNSALDKSGGLDTSGGLSSISIVDSTFRANHGGGGAGAIGHGGGTMTIDGSTISGNTSGGQGGGGIGNSDDTTSGGLAWAEARFLQNYLSCYEAVGDPYWLDKFVDHFDRMLATQQDRNGDGFLAWDTTRYRVGIVEVAEAQ